MNYTNEINNYKIFCDIYFNKFYSHQSRPLVKKNYLRLFQLINLFQLIHNYNWPKNSCLSKLAEFCLSSLYNLLIAIPSNNDLFIASCTRQFDEELLEIVYSQYCDNNISNNVEKLLNLNYRSLWENGIQITQQYKKLSVTKRDDGILREKEKLDAINDLFKKDSDKLHFKYQPLHTSKYLQEIVTKGIEFDRSQLSQHIVLYHRFCVDLLPIIIKIDIKNMTFSDQLNYINLIKSLKLL